MNFSWIYQVPDKGWWANYRWHIVKKAKELGLKSNNWKKSFFRSGWQSKVLEIEGIKGAKKCLRSLQNGTITAFGGKFRGASYDKNAERIIKQARNSLKEAIKKHNQGENINIQESAIVPPSYYNWRLIISSGGIILILLGLAGIFLMRKKRIRRTNQKL